MFLHHPEPTLYASNSLFILITALSAGSLALPNDVTSILYVRSVSASVAGYNNDECTVTL